MDYLGDIYLENRCVICRKLNTVWSLDAERLTAMHLYGITCSMIKGKNKK